MLDHRFWFTAIAVMGMGLSGCETDDAKCETGGACVDTAVTETPTAMGLGIAGSYVDGFGTTHEITDARWTQTYGPLVTAFTLTQYDNEAQWVVGQNDPSNVYFGGLWSRFDWVEVGGALYYCQSTYDAADEATALGLPRADDANVNAGGCGAYDFPWTNLTF